MIEKHNKYDDEYEQAVSDLVDSITESLQSDYQSDVEPFDVYIKKVRFSLIRNIKDFADRFRKGHASLLKELKKD